MATRQLQYNRVEFEVLEIAFLYAFGTECADMGHVAASRL